MVEFFGYDVNSLTAYSVMLLIPEVMILIFFKKDSAGWKYRLGNLTIKTWKVATGIFSVFIVLFFFGNNISQLVIALLGEFEYREMLAPVTLAVTFVWIWHFIVGKKINRTMGLLLLGAAILFGIFIFLNTGYVKF